MAKQDKNKEKGAAEEQTPLEKQGPIARAVSDEARLENETVAERLTRIANANTRKGVIRNKIELGDRIVHILLVLALLGFFIYLMVYIFN